MERRGVKRIQRHFKIKYPSKCRDVRGLLSSNWDTVEVQDFSASGAFFEYDREVKIGAFLDLKLNFPDSEIPIKCVGRVVRIEYLEELSTCRIAVNFVEMDKDVQELANTIVEELSNKEEEDRAPF